MSGVSWDARVAPLQRYCTAGAQSCSVLLKTRYFSVTSTKVECNQGICAARVPGRQLLQSAARLFLWLCFLHFVCVSFSESNASTCSNEWDEDTIALDDINSFLFFCNPIGADWDGNNPKVQYPFFVLLFQPYLSDWGSFISYHKRLRIAFCHHRTLWARHY